MLFLLIDCHPDPEHSLANKTVIETIRSENLESLTYHSLAETSKDGLFDAETEQKRLQDVDGLIFQFPIYWYNIPWILKQWMDQVLNLGFGFGTDQYPLSAKHFFISATAGGLLENYHPLGRNHFRIGDLLRPMEQCCYALGMLYHTPVVSYGMSYFPSVHTEERAQEVKARAAEHAWRLMDKIAEVL